MARFISRDSGDPSHAVTAAAPPLIALRRQRTAERLHRLGPRALAELLAEIGPDAWRIAERYASGLTTEMVRLTGGDRFPPVPLHDVAELHERLRRAGYVPVLLHGPVPEDAA